MAELGFVRNEGARRLRAGRRVPEDIAIVGYDDIDFAAAAAVPLTSVRQQRRHPGLALTGVASVRRPKSARTMSVPLRRLAG
jgi:hypothetical protein